MVQCLLINRMSADKFTQNLSKFSLKVSKKKTHSWFSTPKLTFLILELILSKSKLCSLVDNDIRDISKAHICKVVILNI